LTPTTDNLDLDIEIGSADWSQPLVDWALPQLVEGACRSG
jgi:hypothetical protein